MLNLSADREKLRRVLAKRKKGGKSSRPDFFFNPARGDGSKLEYLGESKMKFTYPCGHSETKDWGKGLISKRMPPEAVRWLTARWKRNGVNVPLCKVCLKKGLGTTAQTAVARQNVKERAALSPSDHATGGRP